MLYSMKTRMHMPNSIDAVDTIFEATDDRAARAYMMNFSRDGYSKNVKFVIELKQFIPTQIDRDGRVVASRVDTPLDQRTL